jgi:hypothetical protein
MLEEVNKEQTTVEVHLFRAMGISQDEQQIIHDLALNAATKAIESAKIVARTAPEPWMVNTITLVACLLVGRAGNAEIKDQAEQQLSHLDPATRRMFEDIVRSARPEPKPTARRDFDGNYG